MFKLEFENDHNDWIHTRHKDQEAADKAAKVKEEAGYRTRVIWQGKIVRESVKEV